jgi:integrase
MISDTLRRVNEDGGSGKQRGEDYVVSRAGTVSVRHALDRDGAQVSARESWRTEHAGTVSPVPSYYPAIQDSRMTFGFFVETKFIPEHVEHKTLTGQTHYQAMLKHLLKPERVDGMFNSVKPRVARLKSVSGWPYLDEVRLCDIKPDHVRRIVAAAFDRAYSAQTVKHIKNVIFAIVSHAQREGCFNGPNPVTQIKLPVPAGKVKQHLTIAQTKEMLEIMQSPDRELALIMITSGLNIPEICNLQWRDINTTESAKHVDGELIPARSIAVSAQWNRSGLGDRKRCRKKNIEIPDVLIPILENLRSQNDNPHPDSFVLLSETGQPILPTSIRVGRLKPIGRKLGIPWLSWQVLRRAQTGFMSEFRSQFNNHITPIAPGEHRVSAASGTNPRETAGLANSDTIGPKFSRHSFRASRSLRENHWM